MEKSNKMIIMQETRCGVNPVLKHRSNHSKKYYVGLAFIYLFVIFGAFISIYPLIFTVLAGFFSATEFTTRMSELGFFPIAQNPTLENFLMIFSSEGAIGANGTILQSFINSVVRTAYSTVFAAITSFIPGFVFARLRFKGKNFLFMALLATVMLPSTITLIPTYILYARWPFVGGNIGFTGGTGILDTFWVYLVTGPVVNVMGTFIVMQSFDKIPREMDEAAKIDGAGVLSVMFKILLPMQVSILTYVMVTTAISTWNDWTTPFFFTNTATLLTLPGAITKLSSAMNSFVAPNYPLMITLGLAITLPCLIIFFIFQRYIVEGLSNAGLKD